VATSSKSVAKILVCLALLAASAAGGCGARTGLETGGGNDAGTDRDVEPPDPCPDRTVTRLRLGAVQQMDLLFVVDSSVSMADKQALLKDAVPPLVTRLVNPLCVDPLTGIGSATASPADPCPAGSEREFAPLKDLHIGVITTSLGAHGGQVCGSLAPADGTPDDHARLLPSVRAGLSSYRDLGFLSWDPRGDQDPPGETDPLRLETDFVSHVSAVGDDGCGYEAPLEALYRFLVDPAPPASVEIGACAGGGTGCSQRLGVDDTLLAQRKAFLRPDSVVAILMLSDENDCSIIDAGQGFLVGTLFNGGDTFQMPRSTSTCATDSNSACCRTCGTFETTPPAGCVPLAQDPECLRGMWLEESEDRSNLRCWDQKRRFGVDLLYPTARYVIGLKEPTICPSSIYLDGDCLCRDARQKALDAGLAEPPCTSAETGEPVPNPLYSNLTSEPAFARDPSQVFLAGIVGIPWQDLATPETLNDPDRLEYLDASELHVPDPETGITRWDQILGDPARGLAGDPFLIESVQPRAGTNPITGQPILAPALEGPTATINGHEYENSSGVNLQYACTFQLAAERDCSMTDPTNSLACDCNPDVYNPTSPLCQAPEGPSVQYRQYFAKAFPSRRLLEVLRDFGDNSIAASICPKKIEGSGADLGLGYRPAVASLVSRFRCAGLDADFVTDPSSIDYGKVPCSVVAVNKQGNCSCSGGGRFPVTPDARAALLEQLEAQGSCGGSTGVACESYCLCELAQLSGPALQACQRDGEPMGSAGPLSGWCYVDPEQGFGSSEAVGTCPTGQQRNVRVLGNANPHEDEMLYSVCVPSCADQGE
jgi:hypothetical protein